jgi:hypothetical protein
MSKPTDVPFVSVIWLDAWKGATTEVTLKDVDQHHKAFRLMSRGWLLKDDEAGVTIANECGLATDDEGYRGLSFIPRGMIESVEPLIKPRAKRVGRSALSVPAPTSA